MKWETPAFVEINMSAEIGGYQTDFDDDREPAGPPRRATETANAATRAEIAPSALPCVIRVLGSAAGGGFPQWNCGCDNCRRGARGHAARVRPRTQESVAVSADGESWFLINCSPEIRAQIESFAGLWPRAKRHSPIAGMLLDQRRSRPLPGLAVAARVAPAGGLRDRRRCAPGSPRATCSTGPCSAFPGRSPGARSSSGASSCRWRAAPRACASPRCRRRASCRCTWNVAHAQRRGQHRARRCDDPRTGGRLAYFSGVAGPSPEIERAIAGAGRGVLRRHVLVSDELIAAGSGRGAPRRWRTGRSAAPRGACEFLERSGARAADPDPRQQHQPDPARGRRRAARARRGRRRGRRRTAWS